MTKDKLPLWIAKSGLNFSCTGCGKCCTEDPGFVFLTKEDIQRLAIHLQISKEKFLTTYCKKVGGKYSLIEKENFDCIFFKNKQCTLYNARPKQCRTYPFWDDIIQSKTSWKNESYHCEGINHKDASKISKLQIINQKSET